MSLWESQDAALATGGKNTLSWKANGVSIDSRTIQKGDLFVALKAERDGPSRSAFKATNKSPF